MSVLTSIIDRSISGSFSSNAINIKYWAFRDCKNLTSVIFPNTIQIQGEAFYDCTGLTTAHFPKVASIGAYAFRNCTNLRDIYIGTNTSTVCTISNGSIFYNCPNLINIYVPSTLVDSYKSAYNWSDYADKIKAAP